MTQACLSLPLHHFSIGPPGKAICAYRADNSMATGGTGFNRGIFDIFREDPTVVMSNGMTAERENTYVEVCCCGFLSL